MNNIEKITEKYRSLVINNGILRNDICLLSTEWSRILILNEEGEELLFSLIVLGDTLVGE